MKLITLTILGLLMATVSFAETINFDKEEVGKLPTDWISGVTEGWFSRLFYGSSPKWTVETDETAPSRPHILKQSGRGTFPWCVKKDVSLTDGFVEVKFKPLSGNKDQAGGLVWRFKDSDNYYVARANALENNVSIYHTESGSRKTIKYVDAPVTTNQWHTLTVTFFGKHITVAVDGTTYIELDDDHISGAGAVGVWTKADSVTSFDDFSYGAK